MRTTTSDGTDIAWEEHGSADAPALVLLHSLGMAAEMWRPQSETLADRFHLIVPDLRGHGRSDVPPGPYSIDLLSRDVLEVADAAGVETFAVCGISIGGLVALWLGIHAGDRLDAVIACDTGAKIGTEESWRERADLALSGGLPPLLDASLERWFSTDFGERHPEWLDAVVGVFLATDPAGYAACCEALATADLRDQVGSVSTPTLLMAGSRDMSTPPELAEWIGERIPGSEVAVIEDASHLSNLDRHDAFDETLLRFLSPE